MVWVPDDCSILNGLADEHLVSLLFGLFVVDFHISPKEAQKLVAFGFKVVDLILPFSIVLYGEA